MLFINQQVLAKHKQKTYRIEKCNSVLSCVIIIHLIFKSKCIITSNWHSIPNFSSRQYFRSYTKIRPIYLASWFSQLFKSSAYDNR